MLNTDLQEVFYIIIIVTTAYTCYKRSEIYRVFYWLILSLHAATLLLYMTLLNMQKEIQNVVTLISRQ